MHGARGVGERARQGRVDREGLGELVDGEAVLDRENETLWRNDRLINRGTDDGLAESDLVLDGDGPIAAALLELKKPVAVAPVAPVKG